jgi:hypothetical protein
MSSDHAIDVFAGVAMLARLLTTVADLAVRLQQLEQRDRNQQSAPLPPQIETGVDLYGNPVRYELVAKRPRGRPRGSRNRPKPVDDATLTTPQQTSRVGWSCNLPSQF